MTLLKPAVAYFAIVFGVGFCLGTFRVLVAVPRLGVRTAELIELPFMLVASVGAAQWVGRRFTAVCEGPSTALAVGGLAFGLSNHERLRHARHGGWAVALADGCGRSRGHGR
jgi:hypothetical protein